MEDSREAIENGMSQRKAAEQFNVPRATLQFRTSKKFNEKTTLGPNPILSLEEENRLKHWIITCQDKGFPRTPEAVTAASSAVSEKDVKKWFTGVQEYLHRKGYIDILQDPSRILNGDETCFLLFPKNKRVLAVKGSKNVYQIEHHSKVNLTVMFTFTACGEITAPMIIYPYKRIPSNILNTVSREWDIGCSDTGWMKNENFYEYIGNVLYKYLVAKNNNFPVILFVDGHKTHLTIQTSKLCSKLQIILVALYPNATKIIQPADIAAFKPLKANWNRAVLKFRRENSNSVITKENFALVLNTAISQLKSDSIINGFKASGLYPWNPEAIDYSKCLGKIKKPHKGINHTISVKKSIIYEDFVDTVAAAKILEFQNLDNCEELSGDSKLLFNIFNLFQHTIDLSTIQTTETSVITNDIQDTSTQKPIYLQILHLTL
ncbi:uncharacterized protein [Diabrotica undecimpunctata]|uniref:uncharacterized protein n=1 Tax=Diabrotica undecimpunctata TaxID=50387 RepID=UPI003B638CB4